MSLNLEQCREKATGSGVVTYRPQATGYRTHTVATREIDERSSPRSFCMEVPLAGCQSAGVLIDLVEPWVWWAWPSDARGQTSSRGGQGASLAEE